jgi:hypothetical protein
MKPRRSPIKRRRPILAAGDGGSKDGLLDEAKDVELVCSSIGMGLRMGTSTIVSYAIAPPIGGDPKGYAFSRAAADWVE